MVDFAALPQEIIDEIIDNLRLDKASLGACALVCSTWRYRSQMHLHHTTRLTPKKVFFGCYSSPIIRSFVKELLCDHIGAHPVLDHPSPQVEEKWSTLLDDFPSVTSLTIRKSRPCRPSLFFPSNLFENLTRLELVSVELPNPASLIFIVLLSPKLSHLVLRLVRWSGHSGCTRVNDENIIGATIKRIDLEMGVDREAGFIARWTAALADRGSLVDIRYAFTTTPGITTKDWQNILPDIHGLPVDLHLDVLKPDRQPGE